MKKLLFSIIALVISILFISCGGGGGSGYTDGSVEIIATQLGGSTGDAKCILRVVT